VSRWRSLALASVVALFGASVGPVWAQEKPAPSQPAPERDLVLERSLPLRTALHHDPTLSSPLERLHQIFREADRLDELIGMYRTHLRSYPRDLSARTVFVRLLLVAGDGESEKELRRSTSIFPRNGYLAYLRFQVLAEDNDPRALDLLDRAIGLEKRPVRKRAWIQRLLTLAVAQDRRDLARKHLKAYSTLLGKSARAHLSAARKMQAFGFYHEALEELAAAAKKRPSPEIGVEIELLGANAEVALKQPEAAAKRLDALLGRLTVDYWRRPEILRRRARLISSSKEREALVAAGRAAWTKDKSPAKALDLARLLSGFDRFREALEVLLEASAALPQVANLEKECLALFDRLRDEHGRIAYLDKRLEVNPKRLDLAEQRMHSLFMLGRSTQAQKALDGLIAPLSNRDKVKRLAGTARFLRAQAFPSFSADVFRKAVEVAPARLDLRRELAETLIAVGERGQAHAALRRPLPLKVDVALFLDLIQVMMREDLYRVARVALAQQLKARPEHFALLLALLEVEGRLGNGARGRRLVEQTRALADNQARYRRWLEAALGFYEFFWLDQEFFTEERERFEKKGPWPKTRRTRLLAFADLCAAQQRTEELAALLEKLLERKGLPKSLALELRRRVVAAPSFEPEEVKATIAHLERLAKEDPTRKGEYRARLALAYAAKQRMDKARDLLSKVDPSQLRDGDLLRSLAGLARALRDGERALTLLARVTDVDSGDREAWERYVYALASTGDEARLRGALRQILRASTKLPLKAEVRRVLRSHLADSSWRSVSALLHRAAEKHASRARGHAADVLEALALLDQVERTSDEGRAWLWVAWTRAYAYNRLGRDKERDAAIQELDRAFAHQKAIREREAARAKAERDRLKEAEEARKKGEAKKGPPRRPNWIARLRAKLKKKQEEEKEPPPTALPGVTLVLPDGICASPEAARRALTQPLAPVRPKLVDRGGPLAPLKLKWAYDAPAKSPIVSVQRLGSQRLLVSDQSGNVSAVSRTTGKLEWVKERLGSSAGTHTHRQVRRSGTSTWTSTSQEFWPPRAPVTAFDGSWYMPEPGAVVRYDRNGKRLAEIRLASAKELKQTPAPSAVVLVSEARTFVFEPCTGQVAALERATSKLLWLTQLPKPKKSPPRLGPRACGASLAGDRLFVYGRWSAILDARTGKVGWSFEPERVRKAAVRLTSEDSDPLALLLPGLGMGGGGPFAGGVGGGQPDQGPRLVDHITRSSGSWSGEGANATTRLVGPAVMWSRSLGQNAVRRGVVVGSHLVLSAEGGALHGTRVMNLDLPMFARKVGVRGATVGSYGELLVLLGPSGLEVVDLEKGSSRLTIGLTDLEVSGRSPRLTATLDGPLAYVSGAKGVLCANVVTGTRLFLAEWPELVRPTVEFRPNATRDYGPSGIMVQQVQTTNRGGRTYLRPVGLAADGDLFLPSDPWRLVALTGKDGQ
jgi:hypothetical protein